MPRTLSLLLGAAALLVSGLFAISLAIQASREEQERERRRLQPIIEYSQLLQVQRERIPTPVLGSLSRSEVKSLQEEAALARKLARKLIKIMESLCNCGRQRVYYWEEHESGCRYRVTAEKLLAE